MICRGRGVRKKAELLGKGYKSEVQPGRTKDTGKPSAEDWPAWLRGPRCGWALCSWFPSGEPQLQVRGACRSGGASRPGLTRPLPSHSFSSSAPGRARSAAAGQLRPGPESRPSGCGPPSRGVAGAGTGPLQHIRQAVLPAGEASASHLLALCLRLCVLRASTAPSPSPPLRLSLCCCQYPHGLQPSPTPISQICFQSPVPPTSSLSRPLFLSLGF